MSAFSYTRIVSPIQLAFTSGTARSAFADALTTKSLTEIFPPEDFSKPALSSPRSAASLSIRTSTER
jgi:hypothetical protein